MALLQLHVNSSTTAAQNSASLAAALLLSVDGVRLVASPASYQIPFRATSGRVAALAANQTLAGQEVVYGSAPVTRVKLTETDGAGGNVVAMATNGVCSGVTVRDLDIDGGRAIGGWGSQAGACISVAGQNDYPAGANRHNVRIINVRAYDGLTQQTSFNSVNGFTLDRLYTWATTGPTVAAHGGDFDAVAYDKPSDNGVIQFCDLDAYGQECLKFENSRNITVRDSTIRMYVSLVQDKADNYSELTGIVFDRCTIMAAINLSFLKRRHVPGQPANTRMTTQTLTVSAAGTVGGTITATHTGTFIGGDIGKSVGAYSGNGTGFGVIEQVIAGTATIRVHDIFANNDGSPLVFEANEWVLGYCDSSGGGALSITRCTFTVDGCIWPQDGNSANYGAQTITDTIFDLGGNSYKYPAGVTPTVSGNTNDALPLKRFARPTLNAKYGALGGTGVAGLNEGMGRASATDNINTAIGYALNGEEVVCVDGLYTATAGGANRSINLGGKTITVRAETALQVWVDLRGGSGWSGLASSADVVGSLLWGFVFWGAGQGGGNGANVNISSTSAIRLRKVAAVGGVTANNGANYRITSTGAWVVEDYYSLDANGGATVGGVYVSAVPAGTPGTLRRGVIRGSTTSGAGIAAAARFDSAGLLVDGIEATDNSVSGATSIAGISCTKNTTIDGLTAANNVSGATAVCNDLSVANTFTVTGHSWICRSNANGLKPLNASAASGAIVLDKSNIVGWVSTAADVVNGSPGTCTLTNISGADPQFADSAGGNYQLKSTSPCRGAGTARTGGFDVAWDYYGSVFAAADQGAWAYN